LAAASISAAIPIMVWVLSWGYFIMGLMVALNPFSDQTNNSLRAAPP
jgi:hypothetical protein